MSNFSVTSYSHAHFYSAKCLNAVTKILPRENKIAMY